MIALRRVEKVVLGRFTTLILPPSSEKHESVSQVRGHFSLHNFFFLLLGLSCLLQQLPGKQSSGPRLRSKASAPHLPLNLMTLVPARRCKGYLTFIKRESEREGEGRKGKEE